MQFKQRRALIVMICLIAMLCMTACGKDSEVGFEHLTTSDSDINSFDNSSESESIDEPCPDVSAENALLLGKEMIEFGAYEQDHDYSNGPEAIKWIVLEKDEDKVLLLSAYGLFCTPFDEGDIYSGTDWSKCTLRKKCNEDFYQEAFTKDEQNQILETKLRNDANPINGAGGCKDTIDKIFCLSFEELNQYFENTWTENENSFVGMDAMCEITPSAKISADTQAISQRLYNREYKNDGISENIIGITYCNYWLRTSDMSGKGALMLYYNGGNTSFYEENGSYNYTIAVRPAMWVDRSVIKDSYICKEAKSINKVYQVPVNKKDAITCISFGDEDRYTLAADVEKYMSEYNEPMTFYDESGNELFELEAGGFELRTYYQDVSNEYQMACSNQNYTKREKKHIYYTIFESDDSYTGKNAMLDDKKWSRAAYFNFGNGVNYPCQDNLYAKLNHDEYRLSLMDDEIKELLFKTEDDYKWLMPTTDDFKVEFFDVPKVGKLAGYTAGYDDMGNAIYGGFVNLKKGIDTMTCRLITVESYDHYGRVVSFSQRISYKNQEDCYYNLLTESFPLYFEDYTGVNKIPEKYDAAELITEINDHIQLQSLFGDWENAESKAERIGCAYYYKMTGDDIPTAGNGFYNFCRVDAPNLANYSDGAKCFSVRVPYDYYWVYSYNMAGFRSYVCDATLFYSMPSQHIGNYYIGKGEHYEKGFAAVTTENYYVANPKDEIYFIPATDDYFLFWKGGQHYSNNDFAMLLSFNENGELIQAIKRIYRADNVVTSMDELLEYEFVNDDKLQILYKDDNYAYLDMMSAHEFDNYTKKRMPEIFEEHSSENGGINVPTEATSEDFYVYINDPTLNEKNTYRENAVKKDEFAFLEDITLYTNDYAVYYYDDSYTVYGSSDGEKYDTPYEVQEYLIYFFDETGLQAENDLRIVDCFASEAEAIKYETFVKTYCPDWNPERVGTIVAVDGFAKSANKFSQMKEKGKQIYFSIPYYTDAQSNYLAEHGWRY